jgi:hypothetical protein
MYKPKAKRGRSVDNLTALSLDGRKEVSEDFADSPFADREEEKELI